MHDIQSSMCNIVYCAVTVKQCAPQFFCSVYLLRLPALAGIATQYIIIINDIRIHFTNKPTTNTTKALICTLHILHIVYSSISRFFVGNFMMIRTHDIKTYIYQPLVCQFTVHLCMIPFQRPFWHFTQKGIYTMAIGPYTGN